MRPLPYRKLFTVLFVISLGTLCLSGVTVSPDYRKIEPLVAATDEPAVAAAQNRIMGAAALPGAPAPVFIRLNTDDPSFPDRIGNLGGRAARIAPRIYTGRIPRDAARYISNWPQVSYIESARIARHMLDVSGPAVSADIVRTGAGLPPPFDNTGVTGAGAYVGVVDTGLSGAHADFHSPGAPTPDRVVHTYSSPGLPSLGISPDPLVDEDGHGTHVTGIAAGNGFLSGGTYTGMAPGAGILFGKTSFFTDDVVTAVGDLLNFAGTTPVAVNVSLGLMGGPHDGSSAFESAVNALAAGTPGSKRLIAVAAGNERTASEHFQAAVGPFGATTATVIFAGGAALVPVDLWADGNDTYTVTATMGTSGVAVVSGTSGASPDSRISVSNKTSAPPNGATNIFVTFLPSGGATTGAIRLTRTRNGGTGRVDGYVENTDGTFSGSTASGTIIEPANGASVLAVGSYNTKTSGGVGLPAPQQDISFFSSLGPARNGTLKPDIAAPGSVIDAARSLQSTLLPIGANSNYTRLQGTSMATPHVTGIAALVWQSNPALTGAQVRERLRKTANPPTDGSTPPNTTWGYGKVNAFNAVSRTVASITASATVPTGTPATLSAENSSGGFGAAITTFAWSAPGASVVPPNADNTTFSANTPGDYTVSLTVTAGGSPATTTRTIRVNNVPTAAIGGPATDSGGGLVTFNGAASLDPDGTPPGFHWVLVTRPAGSSRSLVPNGATAALTPDIAGTYTVGLRADDGLDNSALATHAFTAQPLAGAPAISSSPVTVVAPGASYAYQVTAVGTAPIAYALTAAPQGMTINSATGLITWTPSPGQEGVQAVEVRASNGIFSDAVQAFFVGVGQSGQTAPPAATGGGGGGGGCSIATNGAEDPRSVPVNALPMFAAAGLLAVRKAVRSRVPPGTGK